MKRNQTIAFLLLAAMLASVSCGGGSGDTPGNDTTLSGNDSETTPVEEGYDYQGKDFEEYELKILNLDEQFDCYIRVDIQEQTGEKLDDAVYARNRFVEDQLNFKINEIILPRGAEYQTGQQAIVDLVMQSVMADDDDYDAAYLPTFYKRDILSTEYLLNLLDIPELHVYEDYWDPSINHELTVKDRLLAASGPLNLQSMDMSWVLLFNHDLMDENHLEYPYQLVRDGKWTVDKMHEYISAAVNLNGDVNFRFAEDGNSVYGIAGHTSSASPMLYATATEQYEYDSNGDIQLTLGGERIFIALEKLEKLFTTVDGHANLKSGLVTDVGSNLWIFNANRSLFFINQLKSALELRNMESTFGLLPMPKLDETQENYRTMIGTGSELLSIPVTQDDTARVGFLLDALNYESFHRVRPIYNEVTVSQKGLRNDDSIDMLDYIWNYRSINMLSYYGIDTITSAVTGLITTQTTNTAASVIASKESEARQNLADFLATLEE